MWRRSFSISSIWLYLSVLHVTNLIMHICMNDAIGPQYLLSAVLCYGFCVLRRNDNTRYAIMSIGKKQIPNGLKRYAEFENGLFIITFTEFSRWEGFLLNTIMYRASGFDFRVEHLSYWIIRDPFRIIEYAVSVISFTVWTFRLSRIPLTGLVGERKTW